MAVALVVVLAWVYERQSEAAFANQVRAEARDALYVLRADLRGRLDANVQLIQGLVAVLGAAPDLDQRAFEALAARLVNGGTEIRIISAAPNLVIDRIYPLAGNEAALGLDYRREPEQFASVRLARDFGVTILAGPVALVQGGRGIIARSPVFRHAGTLPGAAGAAGAPAFWGIVSAVIDPDRLYAAAGLTDPGLALEVALLGRDGRADADAAAGVAPFFGDAAVLAQNPVTARIELAHGAWELAAAPKGGWPSPPTPWGTRALFALAAFVIVVPIAAMARLVASRQAKLAVIREREAELSRLSWRLEFALAASDVGVWDVDLATNELIWDDRAKALFGQSGRDGPFSDVDWTGALHPDDRTRATEQAEATASGAGKFLSDYRIVRPDGAVRHIRDVAQLYEGEAGSRRLVGLVWDVSADVERQAEFDLRRREAEAATVAKSRFLAAMSHEIRTPMGGVLGLLELMLGDRLAPRQRERARIAMTSARGLLGLLNDILDFSRLEADKIQVAEEAVPVRRVIHDTIELMAAEAEAKGLALTHAVADAVPQWIVADPMRLRQVLTNLVSNATKFTEAGSVEVRVGYAAGAEADQLTVAVQDTGIGIDDEACARLFQHFERADNSLTRRVGGTGLGLVISKRLVELMGGRIAVESRPGAGSTFRFTIRTRPAEAPDLRPGVGAGRGDVAPTAPGLAPQRVLLAEDNPTNQYLINAYLGAMGCQVTTVGTGAEALAAVQAGAFDVVLMDVQMPVMDGLTAARAIRGLQGPAAALPIIALTANAMPGDREACVAHGMTDYLSKPLGAAALREALDRARAPAAAPTAAIPAPGRRAEVSRR